MPLATKTSAHTDLRRFVDRLLDEQPVPTAVDQFSQTQEGLGESGACEFYRDLIPVGLPNEGQQFAFEVSLDDCSGCKACVAACHNLNGLEDDELWRNVGVLVGGSSELPVIQHVTTACHHCIEPACLDGCPVEAYEKDKVTGIVRHLDDQCIGCQYCILKCPYDVPVYSKSKGIVRKCDMCHQRLVNAEAPACVQSCPNRAIRIRTVSNESVREDSETNRFLPGAPNPDYTLPTTTYSSSGSLPRNTIPADYFSAKPAKGHVPLVVMLVLTQMSVGAFVIEQAMYSYFAVFRAEVAAAVRPWHLVTALLLGIVGIVASVFHLGRPLYAYRALLGLRTSWLSREILAFGVFALASSLYVALAIGDSLFMTISTNWQAATGSAAALAGSFAVICSVMIYVDTRRPLWTPSATSIRFFLTALVLGLPTAFLVSFLAASLTDESIVQAVKLDIGSPLCKLLVATTVVKLLFEVAIFRHLRSAQHTPAKRTALLMKGELSMTTMRRFFFGIIGGVCLPLVLLGEPLLANDGYHTIFIGVATALTLLLLTIGELHERFLFFAASVAPKMPGVPAT